MTLPTTDARFTFTASGTGPYNFPRKLLAAADLKVRVDGVLQTISTNYTVALSGSAPVYSSADVTFVTAPTAGAHIEILRDPAQIQEIALVGGGVYATLNTQFDRAEMKLQALADKVNRAPHVGNGAGASFNGLIAADVEGKAGYVPMLTGSPTPTGWTIGLPISSAIAVSEAMVPVVTAASLQIAREALGVPKSVAIFHPADYMTDTEWTQCQQYDLDAQDETAITAALRAMLDAAVVYVNAALGERSAVVNFDAAGYAVNDELFSDTALATIYGATAPAQRSEIWLVGAGHTGGTVIKAKNWGSAVKTKATGTRLAGETVPSALLRIEQKLNSWGIIIHAERFMLLGGLTQNLANIDTDPVGLWIANANLQHFREITISNFAGGGFWLEGGYNSRFHDIHVQNCGWNPTEAGSLGTRNGLISSTVRFDCTAGTGDSAIVADEPVFEALHVTNNAWFFVHLAAGNGDWLQGQITAVADSTHATIDVEADSNQTGVTGSFGVIRGTISSVASDAQAKTLLLSNAIEATNLVGRYIHIPKAGSTSVVTAVDQHDLFSTRIAAYDNGTRTVTLEHPAEVTVANVPIFFAPQTFIGRTQDSEFDNRNNDLYFSGWRTAAAFDAIRGGAVSLIAQDMDECSFVHCKFHGNSSDFNNFGANACSVIVDNCPNLDFISPILTWGGNLPEHGKVWVMGEENMLTFFRARAGTFREGSKTARLMVDPKLASASFANYTQIDWGVVDLHNAWPTNDQVDVRLGTNGLASMVRFLHPISQRYTDSRSRWPTQYTNILDANSIELGHASANTLTASGGVLSIEGGIVPKENRANTFTALQTVSRAGVPATLTNTTDAAANQGLIIESDRANPAAFDQIYATFRLSDSAGNQDEFGRLSVQGNDVTSGSEDGRFIFSVMSAGVLTGAWLASVSAFFPSANDGGSIGASGAAVSDYFGATGHVFNLGAGNYTLTHSAGALTANGALADPVARLQAIPRSTTAALAAIGNAINTTNKFANKTVINTTAGTIVTAAGAAAGDVWQALDGTTAHTPV